MNTDYCVEVGTVLAGLPQKKEEIAMLLLDLGIKGYINSGSSCPITNYVHKKLPHLAELAAVHVCKVDVWVAKDGRHLGTIQLPHAVQSFVLDFDNGNYPQLTLNEAS